MPSTLILDGVAGRADRWNRRRRVAARSDGSPRWRHCGRGHRRRAAADRVVHLEREQFGKPLSTFQAVALKAADAYLDTTAIRRPPGRPRGRSTRRRRDARVLTAAWWAAEGGQHCVHLTQHLHGGMGADITYPVHRYFLWGKQIELSSAAPPRCSPSSATPSTNSARRRRRDRCL